MHLLRREEGKVIGPEEVCVEVTDLGKCWEEVRTCWESVDCHCRGAGLDPFPVSYCGHMAPHPGNGPGPLLQLLLTVVVSEVARDAGTDCCGV